MNTYLTIYYSHLTLSPMETKTEPKQDVKGQILCKSEERFSHYGFNKTTMAEIAKDCEMSAANLYRYFENKEEIGVHIVEQCMEQKESLFRDILQNSGLSAAVMLEKIIVEELKYLYNEIDKNHKIIELVQFISENHINIVDSHIQRKKALIAEVMAQGNRSGEFNISDILAAADTFITATMRFWVVPLFFMFKEPLEKLEPKAINLVRGLINGLKKS